jgi:NAD(P)H dehydrogenase (quinone)
MRHLVVLAHPRQGSFTRRVAATYMNAVQALGHESVLRDLYAIGFNPIADDTECFTRALHAPADDVKAEMDQVRAADVLVFVCPIWWIAPPAMMKGWLDRVLRPGFAYGHRADGKIGGLLTGKKGLVFTSAGSTVQEFLDSGKMQSIRAMWDVGTIRFCDMALLDHVHFGPVGSRASAEMIEGYIAEVGATVRRHFSDA